MQAREDLRPQHKPPNGLPSPRLPLSEEQERPPWARGEPSCIKIRSLSSRDKLMPGALAPFPRPPNTASRPPGVLRTLDAATAPHLFRRRVRSPGQSQPCSRAPGALPGALLLTLVLTFTKPTLPHPTTTTTTPTTPTTTPHSAPPRREAHLAAPSPPLGRLPGEPLAVPRIKRSQPSIASPPARCPSRCPLHGRAAGPVTRCDRVFVTPADMDWNTHHVAPRGLQGLPLIQATVPGETSRKACGSASPAASSREALLHRDDGASPVDSFL
ncbi:unnamed protein product [Rangifer tarandus platyrhynchus]|uniref:Uncharacterized protein n=1 Tax=Rangifer tarandus platyrhynchus TaxID=3082113 RepID=A0AC59YST0_RANTA